MITDRETNILYLSSLLKSEFAQFWADLKLILDRHSIKYQWIDIAEIYNSLLNPPERTIMELIGIPNRLK